MTTIKIHPERFNSTDLQPAVSILQRGGLIAYPTETVYGLGANIYDQKAVRKIFEIKRRERQKPLSVMIASHVQVEELCMDLPNYAYNLIATHWPGPLTLILRASARVPDYITSADNKIGLRMPDHCITKALMKLHREPITSTSANVSGVEAPVRAQEVVNTFADKIDLIIDGGECKVKIPSTVLDATGEAPRILRAGAISFLQIERCLQRSQKMKSRTFKILFACSGNSCRSPMAEGLLKSKLPVELKDRVTVQSAGTLGLNGNPATNFAIEVTQDLGANIFHHRSQGLTEELVKDADLIFAMAPEHRIFLQNHYPEVRENVFLLKSFARDPDDKYDERIEDPIGGNLEVYKKCVQIIDSELDRILPRLIQLIEEKLSSR